MKFKATYETTDEFQVGQMITLGTLDENCVFADVFVNCVIITRKELIGYIEKFNPKKKEGDNKELEPIYEYTLERSPRFRGD